MFDALPKSTVLDCDGATRAFPHLDDYRARLIERGDLGADESLSTRRELVTAIQTHWHRSGQTGCVFARILSDDPPGNKWLIVPVIGMSSWTKEDWTTNVRDPIRSAITNPDVWLVSLLFPDVTEPLMLRTLIRGLASLDGWSVEVAEAAEVDGRGTLVNVGARLALPGGVASWGLGLAPFSFMPITRQSPFTELVLAVKPKGPIPLHPELSNDPGLAHVADAPVPIASIAVDGIWKKTRANKRLHLRGVDDRTAKAKVTFSLPLNVWAMADEPAVARPGDGSRPHGGG